jgi:hypothetical protein
VPKPPTPLGFSIPSCPVRELREEGAAAAPRRRSGAWTGSQELDLGKADAMDIYLTDETLFPGRQRLHRCPTVSTARPPCSLPLLGPFPVMVRRR